MRSGGARAGASPTEHDRSGRRSRSPRPLPTQAASAPPLGRPPAGAAPHAPPVPMPDAPPRGVPASAYAPASRETAAAHGRRRPHPAPGEQEEAQATTTKRDAVRVVAGDAPAVADAPPPPQSTPHAGSLRPGVQTHETMNFNFCNGSRSPRGNEILFSAQMTDFDHHSCRDRLL